MVSGGRGGAENGKNYETFLIASFFLFAQEYSVLRSSFKDVFNFVTFVLEEDGYWPPLPALPAHEI